MAEIRVHTYLKKHKTLYIELDVIMVEIRVHTRLKKRRNLADRTGRDHG